jgi:hypothetical protein
VPGDLQTSAAEFGAAADEAARQLLDQARTEGTVQHRLNALAANQRVTGDGEIAQPPAPHPFFKADRPPSASSVNSAARTQWPFGTLASSDIKAAY